MTTTKIPNAPALGPVHRDVLDFLSSGLASLGGSIFAALGLMVAGALVGFDLTAAYVTIAVTAALGAYATYVAVAVGIYRRHARRATS